MVVNSDILISLESGVRTEFNNSFGSVKTYFGDFTTKINSTKSKETYAFLGDTPQLSEFLDTRKIKNLSEYSFEGVNKKFESTISISRVALEDDQTGELMRRAQMLGVNVAKSYDRLAVAALELGESEVGYDGEFFFSASHGDGLGGTQANIKASAPMSAANIKLIIDEMGRFQTDQGELAGMMADTVMVPTSLRWTANEILNTTVVAGSTTVSERSLAGALNIIVNPYLANDATPANSAYYVMDLSTGLNPIIFQERMAPEITSLNSPDSEHAFKYDEYLYGVRARFAFVYGNWRSIYKADGNA